MNPPTTALAAVAVKPLETQIREFGIPDIWAAIENVFALNTLDL